MYGTQSVEILDGAQLNWRVGLGGVILTSQASYGKGSNKAYVVAIDPNANFVIDSDRIWGVNLIAEYHDWLVRVGTARVHTPAVYPIAGPVMVQDNYDSVGLQYDNGTALVMAEVAQRTQNKVIPVGGSLKSLIDAQYGYLAAGWRLGPFLPMATVSRAATKVPAFNVKHSVNGVGASLRYDVAPNVALKAQVNRHSADDDIAFVNPRQGDTSKVNAYAIGLDFVF